MFCDYNSFPGPYPIRTESVPDLLSVTHKRIRTCSRSGVGGGVGGFLSDGTELRVNGVYG